MKRPDPSPCTTCPYRRDVAPGVWSFEEYEKLRRYDEETGHQPTGVFTCHKSARKADGGDRGFVGDRVCGGWAGCHDTAHLLALRLAEFLGTLSGEELEATYDYVSPVPLFATGAEAADHGQRGIEDPGPEALRAMELIERARRRRS